MKRIGGNTPNKIVQININIENQITSIEKILINTELNFDKIIFNLETGVDAKIIIVFDLNSFEIESPEINTQAIWEKTINRLVKGKKIKFRKFFSVGSNALSIN